jgi:hypothetical protein
MSKLKILRPPLFSIMPQHHHRHNDEASPPPLLLRC